MKEGQIGCLWEYFNIVKLKILTYSTFFMLGYKTCSIQKLFDMNKRLYFEDCDIQKQLIFNIQYFDTF